jgi:hypothetical protein
MLLLNGLIYMGAFLTLANSTNIKTTDFIYNLLSNTLFFCFVIYILKNYFFLNKDNLLIPSTNSYIQRTRTTQLVICIVLMFYMLVNIYFLRITPIYNIFNVCMLSFIFVFFNFQLYKRFFSNNISLFPLIYQYRNSMILR